ncbi:hypothetical protein E5S70_04945 [Ensifer adhaerens]|uniref:hypothetical protein n=1 Tax=Ensifer canadensis TaxID=555315 RepID=UPI00148FEF25|nr:hypothetical protein [Ensifer canadensis]NOV15441.1 hypothetical protein [Ensifer canadensis]
MINLMALRPSQWDRLEQELADPSRQDEFLEGLEYYLKNTSAEEGVDTDRIYVTAIKTENAEAWQHIAADRLFVILKSIDAEVGKIFLSGVSKALEAELRPQLDAYHASEVAAVVKESAAEPAPAAPAAPHTLEAMVKLMARKAAREIFGQAPFKPKGKDKRKDKRKGLEAMAKQRRGMRWASPDLTYHRIETRALTTAEKGFDFYPKLDPNVEVNTVPRQLGRGPSIAVPQNIKGVVTIIDGNHVYVVGDK